MIDGLTLRVEALEKAQARMLEEMEASEVAEDEGEAHEEVTEPVEQHEEPAATPEPEQAGRRFGWWRR